MGACARCGYEKNAEADLACGMCHEPLGPKKAKSTPPAVRPTQEASSPFASSRNDDDFMKNLLVYTGPGKALKLMGGSAAVGVPAMAVVLGAQRLDLGRSAMKLAALPLALVFVVFWVGLLQLIFGERLNRLGEGEKELSSPLDILLVFLIVMPMAGVIMVVVGWIALSASK